MPAESHRSLQSLVFLDFRTIQNPLNHKVIFRKNQDYGNSTLPKPIAS